MRKRSQSLVERIGPVRLYRDDLEAILGIMRDNCKSVEINVACYDYESLEELVEKGPTKAIKFSISGHDPYVSTDSNLEGVFLYAQSDDAISAGVWHQIKTILEKAYLKPHFLYLSRYYFIFSVCPLIAIAGVSYFFGAEQRILATPMGIMGLLIAAWSTRLLFVTILKQGDVIYPRQHRHDDTFWERNKRYIIPGVIGGLVTGFFWFLTAVFLKHWRGRWWPRSKSGEPLMSS